MLPISKKCLPISKKVADLQKKLPVSNNVADLIFFADLQKMLPISKTSTVNRPHTLRLVYFDLGPQ